MVSIRNLNKAEVLKALYDNAKPQGLGYLHYDPRPMSVFEAETILKVCKDKNPNSIYFDYLKGRVMKVNLTSDEEFDDRLYDRDNGDGAAQRAIDSIIINNGVSDSSRR